MSTASVNGHSVLRASVQVPAYGCWWATVHIEDDATLTGRVTLTLADLSLIGTVVSGGVSSGRASYRIVGGSAGWGCAIPEQGYRNDGGVAAAKVIQDAAEIVGETVASLPSDRIGQHYARVAGPAYRVLHGLAPSAWRVDFDGVTRFGSRASSAYTGEGPRTRIDPAVGVIDIATETLSGLVPGVTIDGSAPATDVEFTLETKRLSARVWTGPRLSRRLGAWLRLFDALDPRRGYRGVYEYRVVFQEGERFDLQPIRVASGMPDLEGVPVRGPAGTKATVTAGEHVVVAFLDGDPSRPVIMAHDAPDAPGWNPIMIELGANAEFAALASKVDQGFSDVKTYLDAHTHPTGVGPSGPPAVPLTPVATVAASMVKIK